MAEYFPPRYSGGDESIEDPNAPIPLYDGEPLGAVIQSEVKEGLGARAQATPSDGGGGVAAAHSRRRAARRHCDRIMVCFSARGPDGRLDFAECPVINLSKGGFALEYDQKLPCGIACTIAYRTVSQTPVHTYGTIRHCRDLGDGRYQLGVQLSRQLKFEELRPARHRPGRDIADGIRARSLRPRTDETAEE